MKIGETFSYSSLKKKRVVDKDGVTVGKNLIDVVFSPDLGEITHFVVGGGFLEELLEDIKIKKDLDPVFSIENVDGVYEKEVKLSVNKQSLKSVIEGGIPEGHYCINDLSKMDVVGSKGSVIGNIIDVAFFDDGSLSFIIGGSAIEELLEKMKVLPDVDLLLPSKNITSIKDGKIFLDLTREMLKTTLKDNVKKDKPLKKANYQDFSSSVALVSRQSYLR
ncbi:MAG: PRC-barrel domain-containing protein [Candidatus Odinarchaeota archaeon]